MERREPDETRGTSSRNDSCPRPFPGDDIATSSRLIDGDQSINQKSASSQRESAFSINSSTTNFDSG